MTDQEVLRRLEAVCRRRGAMVTPASHDSHEWRVTKTGSTDAPTVVRLAADGAQVSLMRALTPLDAQVRRDLPEAVAARLPRLLTDAARRTDPLLDVETESGDGTVVLRLSIFADGCTDQEVARALASLDVAVATCREAAQVQAEMAARGRELEVALERLSSTRVPPATAAAPDLAAVERGLAAADAVLAGGPAAGTCPNPACAAAVPAADSFCRACGTAVRR